MSYIALFAILMVLAPTVVTAYHELKNKNLFGAVGIMVYLSLIAALAVYQIFLR